MLNPKILNVETLEDYKIKLEYETGEIKVFDVLPYIYGSFYGQLSDKNYFKTVQVVDNGYTIEWKNGQDIAPHELYEMGVSFVNIK